MDGIEYGDRFLLLCILSFIGALFGSIHCIGWSFAFPSSKERLAWRISSIGIAALPCLAPLTLFILGTCSEAWVLSAVQSLLDNACGMCLFGIYGYDGEGVRETEDVSLGEAVRSDH